MEGFPKSSPPREKQEQAHEINFSQCVNIEDLCTLTDTMEKENISLSGSNGESYDAERIRETIAEVRSLRASGNDDMALVALQAVTRQHGLRDAIGRIVHGDSFNGVRDRSSDSQSSATNLDIHVS